MPKRRKAIVLALALVVAAGDACAQRWVPAWIASPAPDRRDGAPRAPLQFADQTVRQDMRLGVSAKALRFRISNELGDAPLKLDSLVAWRIGTSARRMPVRFAGRDAIVVPVGAALLSDPVAIAAPAFAQVALSLHFPDPTRPAVRRTALRAVAGKADVADDAPLAYRQNAISAVLAERDEAPATIVALGDSITEGATAGLGSEGDWPALLARRLEQACPGRYVVLNAGISGNKVLDAGRSHSALARLDRDVLSLPGVDYAVLLEGINDIRHSGAPEFRPGRSADDVILGYRQIVARLQMHGIRTFGATLTPFGGSERYEPVSAAARGQLNAFIRDGGVFAGVVDFDAALRDPARPEFLPDPLTRDHLHPNRDGYAKMARAIDLSLFGCQPP
ncbi:GDSL-type esterase/lipase family protein [Luteimonas sp. SX5]|uniref:GDSL-type esterase/lipase family protein n=1 Tax=Luteimonas galliterrae TaxID=2940486 RepID=A0ABT0MNK7_9GAMM|nr:GDSL-type esterase/lipase family protein [Luteimonas galliterrae]MCL1635845.1 GDSL-type esterase/lipase family protein [Luteimonas galliterrae]